MKNNLEAGSHKVRYSDNEICTRLTLSRIIVGVLATTLLLFSLIAAIAVVTRSHAIAATATLAANSVTKPTPTTTATATATPSPTSSSTPTPTTTTTSTPSPTSTSMASSTPSLSPTSGSTSVAVTNPIAGATSTITAGATQTPGQDQTPTTSTTSNTTTSTPPGQQNEAFLFTALAIGLPSSATAILFLFIGWWLLRKRLLPVKKVKLPPSGAIPWSRVRTSASSWNVNTDTNQIQNAPVMPTTGKPEANSPQSMGNNGYGLDAYEQWLRNNPGVTPDLNDPYLQELIRQYSAKSRAALQQKLGNARDGQASSTQNDTSWMR